MLQSGLSEMDLGVDESGDDGEAGAVDGLGRASIGQGTEGRNLAVRDSDVSNCGSGWGHNLGIREEEIKRHVSLWIRIWPVKICTYNAASVRARLPRLLEWLDQNEPDVVAIQETKVENDKFPVEEFEARGYELALNGQKSWNGVCFLSRLPIENVQIGFGDELMPQDARVISATISGIEIINTYVPNGNTVGSEKWEYKMAWLERFARLLRER